MLTLSFTTVYCIRRESGVSMAEKLVASILPDFLSRLWWAVYRSTCVLGTHRHIRLKYVHKYQPLLEWCVPVRVNVCRCVHTCVYVCMQLLLLLMWLEVCFVAKLSGLTAKAGVRQAPHKAEGARRGASDSWPQIQKGTQMLKEPIMLA